MVQTRPCHGITFSIYTVTPFENLCTTCCLCLKYASSSSELLAPPPRSVFTLMFPGPQFNFHEPEARLLLQAPAFIKNVLRIIFYNCFGIKMNILILYIKTYSSNEWFIFSFWFWKQLNHSHGRPPALPHDATVHNVFTSVTSVSRAEPSSWMNEERYTGLQVKNSLTRVHENWIFWKCFNPY